MSLASPELNFDQSTDYHYGKFPPSNIDYSRLSNQLVKAASAIARLDQMLKNMHNSEILLAPLRNQEAVISSRMEGTVSTMDEILEYEADYDETTAGSTSTRSEVIETILYQRALRNAEKAMESGQPLSESLIKTAHQQLLSFGRGASKAPGKYKTEQNYLADKTKRNILFVPIAPEFLQDGLESLFNYIEKSDATDLIKAAVAHIEFEALHPFKDGNGRIGRMLITLMLWKAKVISAPHYYISGYFEENKDLYIDSMRKVSSSEDWTGWCEFFLIAVEKQAISNLIIAEAISKLYEDLKIRFSELLASQWSVQALDYMFTNPVFRNSKFASNSGIAPQTASRFTRILHENGLIVLAEEASGRRAALYRLEPLMELVRV
jgi:Fic family protein